MKKLVLAELLQYFDEDELIQIVTDGHDWEDAYELCVDSDLLKPFRGYIVLAMRSEESYRDKSPVLRVLIEKGDYHDRLEKKADFSEVLGGGLRVCGDACNCLWRHTGISGTDHSYYHGWCGGAGIHYSRRAC